MRFLFLTVLLALCAGSPVVAYDNVLLITIDTLRADYLSCYGSKKVKTPHIDSLANKGVLFQNVVAPAPYTLPSHVSLFTGLIPPAHGVQDNSGFYLSNDAITLTELLKRKGVNTGAVVAAFPLDSRFGLDQGFDVYEDSYPTVNKLSDITVPERNAEDVTNSALGWLKTQASKPWFLWIHYYDPHFPYRPPERFQKEYADNLYAGEVAYVDEQIGRLIAFVNSTKSQDKTLIVLTSDHGESLGEHEEKTHGIFAYESTLRIPLIFAPYQPKVVRTRARLIDVAPTILALMKVNFPNRIQGASLLKALIGDPVRAPDSYFESLSMHFHAGWAPLRGLYSGNQKFIQLPTPELYDLSSDPEEKKNLCASNQNTCRKWSEKFAKFPYLSSAPVPTPIDSETAEQLQALGYVSGSSGVDKKTYGVADDPKEMIVFHNRIDDATTLYRNGYELKALQILEGVIQERPDYTMAYLNAAFIQSEIGSPEKSVQLLEQARKRGLSGSELEGKMGIYLYEAGKLEQAIRQLQVAIKQDSRNIDNWNYLGVAYTAAKNYPEAEKTFRQALERDSGNAITLTNLGTLFLTQKKFDDATRQFEAAIKANPYVAGAYNGLGVAYASQKKWDLAIKNWTAALERSDRNYDAMLNLAFAYLEQNQREQARALFERFEKQAPPSRYARDLAKVRSILQQLQ